MDEFHGMSDEVKKLATKQREVLDAEQAELQASVDELESNQAALNTDIVNLIATEGALAMRSGKQARFMALMEELQSYDKPTERNDETLSMSNDQITKRTMTHKAKADRETARIKCKVDILKCQRNIVKSNATALKAKQTKIKRTLENLH